MKRENNRDTAEALALLELIEAQEAVRNHRPTKEDYYKYLVSTNNPDEEVWMNARTEPSGRYFGLAPQPPRSYEMINNYAPSKRFMVAKKRKRSLFDDDWRVKWGPNGNGGRHGFPGKFSAFKKHQ